MTSQKIQLVKLICGNANDSIPFNVCRACFRLHPRPSIECIKEEPSKKIAKSEESEEFLCALLPPWQGCRRE